MTLPNIIQSFHIIYQYWSDNMTNDYTPQNNLNGVPNNQNYNYAQTNQPYQNNYNQYNQAIPYNNQYMLNQAVPPSNILPKQLIGVPISLSSPIILLPIRLISILANLVAENTPLLTIV